MIKKTTNRLAVTNSFIIRLTLSLTLQYAVLMPTRLIKLGSSPKNEKIKVTPQL